jgi:hypothetical protein
MVVMTPRRMRQQAALNGTGHQEEPKMVCELCAKTIAKGSNSVQVNYGGYPFAAHYLCFFSRVNGAGSGEQAPVGR